VADYDGDGRADLIVFDGAEKSVWLGNTPLPDGEPPEVWFLSDEPDCRELEPTWDELGVRFGSGGFATRGAVGWLERIGMMPKRCDPTDENLDCPPEPATAGERAASMAWLLDLDPVPGLGDGNGYDAAARALLASGHDSPCPVGDDACWGRILTRAEVSGIYWQLLAGIHDADPEPHRWVVPPPALREQPPLPD